MLNIFFLIFIIFPLFSFSLSKQGVHLRILQNISKRLLALQASAIQITHQRLRKQREDETRPNNTIIQDGLVPFHSCIIVTRLYIFLDIHTFLTISHEEIHSNSLKLQHAIYKSERKPFKMPSTQGCATSSAHKQFTIGWAFKEGSIGTFDLVPTMHTNPPPQKDPGEKGKCMMLLLKICMCHRIR